MCSIGAQTSSQMNASAPAMMTELKDAMETSLTLLSGSVADFIRQHMPTTIQVLDLSDGVYGSLANYQHSDGAFKLRQRMIRDGSIIAIAVMNKNNASLFRFLHSTCYQSEHDKMLLSITGPMDCIVLHRNKVQMLYRVATGQKPFIQFIKYWMDEANAFVCSACANQVAHDVEYRRCCSCIAIVCLECYQARKDEKDAETCQSCHKGALFVDWVRLELPADVRREWPSCLDMVRIKDAYVDGVARKGRDGYVLLLVDSLSRIDGKITYAGYATTSELKRMYRQNVIDPLEEPHKREANILMVDKRKRGLVLTVEYDEF
jgi:hypothetical protein